MLRIELYGQPIHSQHAGVSPIGTEVLFRMGGASPGTQISPHQYLSSMQGGQMGLFMDATVIGFLIAGDTSAIQNLLFLNLSSETLESNDCFGIWLVALTELCRRRNGKVVVEISESSTYSVTKLLDRITAIRRAGARLALDDYPGGPCSVPYLKSAKWDFIKICKKACDDSNLVFADVVQEVAKLCPGASIIGERVGRELATRFSGEQIKGFQSFEWGLPAPLDLVPYESESLHYDIASPQMATGRPAGFTRTSH